MRLIPWSCVLLLGCKASSADSNPQSTPLTSEPVDSAAPTDTEPPVDCTVAVPAEARVVEGIDEAQEAGEVAWVCPGADLTISEPDVWVMLEPEAKAVVSWPGVTVWAPARASVIVLSSGVTVLHDRGATVVNEAPSTELITCDEVVYDLSEAPSPGCTTD